MNQRSRKVFKIFLCCAMGIIIFTGCASTDTPTDPVVVAPSEPEEEKSQLELLAEEYEFLAWYLDDSTSKTIDGVTYDLVALKQEYGDLYRFVEPLSKEEVEYRFQYLAEYFATQAEKGLYEEAPGGFKIISTDITPTAYPRIKDNFKILYLGEVEELRRFSKYYFYLEKTIGYYQNNPESLYFNGEFYPVLLINVVETALLEDKEWFIRDYAAQMDIYLDSYKINNIEPELVLN